MFVGTSTGVVLIGKSSFKGRHTGRYTNTYCVHTHVAKPVMTLQKPRAHTYALLNQQAIVFDRKSDLHNICALTGRKTHMRRRTKYLTEGINENLTFYSIITHNFVQLISTLFFWEWGCLQFFLTCQVKSLKLRKVSRILS